jgi:hypothetical protein
MAFGLYVIEGGRLVLWFPFLAAKSIRNGVRSMVSIDVTVYDERIACATWRWSDAVSSP